MYVLAVVSTAVYRLAICSVLNGLVPYFDPLFRKFLALFRIFRGDKELSNGVSSFFLRHLGAEIMGYIAMTSHYLLFKIVFIFFLNKFNKILIKSMYVSSVS